VLGAIIIVAYSIQVQAFYPFTTTATDTENINKVFESAMAHIIRQNLKGAGLQWE
jgi:hypothetical protein